ncbi:protein of unknown function [Mycoplasma capricolum subsp. capripneumoniae]|nr:protein of unknown function [Mycoplasma capricolum subsp. capripneumoniae]
MCRQDIGFFAKSFKKENTDKYKIKMNNAMHIHCMHYIEKDIFF